METQLLLGSHTVTTPDPASAISVIDLQLAAAPVLMFLLPHGWTVSLAGRDSVVQRPNQLFPYNDETRELLHDLDRQRLPHCLSDILDSHCRGLFVRGGLDVEVRDYRPAAIHLETDTAGATTAMPDVRRVRLQPTAETVLGKMYNLYHEARDTGDIKPRVWSNTEWIGLEQRLLQKLQPPLCLDPSPLIFDIASLIHYNRTKYTGLLGQLPRLYAGHSEGEVRIQGSDVNDVLPASLPAR